MKCEVCGKPGPSVWIHDCGEHSHVVHCGAGTCFSKMKCKGTNRELAPVGATRPNKEEI